MNLYIAGIYTAHFHETGNGFAQLTEREKAGHKSVDNHLESWHYIGKGRYLEHIREDGKKVFLDSGAFSAFMLGVQVDLEAYCRWILQNSDVIRVDETGALMASVLDGIGDPLKTYQNQMAMEQLGVRPLPCFHYGEPVEALDWYVANYSYITLGGMVPISTPQLLHWLDRIWSEHLTDGSGRPKVKVHGFGLTSLDLMTRYPWHSVDSSSWVQIGAHGNILLNGKTLGFSSQSPSRKIPNQHIDSMPEIMKSQIESSISEMGYDSSRLRTSQYARWAFNAEQFAQMGRDQARGKTFDNHQPELFP